MALTNWPTYTDDTGTKTDGTAVDEALFDGMKDAIEDEIVSATNPSLSPADIINEVVDARGSKADLEERLDVATNSDGTLKSVAGQASEAQLSAQLGSKNLVLNGEFLFWQAGAAAAPDFWELSGASAAVARAGSGESDTTHLGAGTYTAKVTSGAGAIAKLLQTVLEASEFTQRPLYRSKVIQVHALIKAAAGSTARLVVDDGVTTTSSSYHTGSGSAEFIAVEHTISGSGTKLEVYLEVAAGTNVVYMSGLQVFESDVARTEWVAERSEWFKPGRRMVGVVAGEPFYIETAIGQETAWTLPGGIPSGFYRQNGAALWIHVATFNSTQARERKAGTSLGGAAAQFWTTTSTANQTHAGFEMYLVRSDTDKLRPVYEGWARQAAAAGYTAKGLGATTSGLDFDSNISFSVEIHGQAASDVGLYFAIIEKL